MKPALYYAIRKNLYKDIVAVTSEKDKGRWYGRYVRDNTATHGAPGYGTSDIIGRFATVEEAEAKRARFASIGEYYDKKRKELQDQISALYRDEKAQIQAEMAE